MRATSVTHTEQRVDTASGDGYLLEGALFRPASRLVVERRGTLTPLDYDRQVADLVN